MKSAAFAIELETLARKAFVDVDASVMLQLVRDRFTLGQENHALRRHLDSVGPDTPISDIVDRCRVWEGYDQSYSGPMARHEPTAPRGVFQVTQQISNEHSEMSTEPDPTPLEFEILAQRLCEMAQQPVPGNSDTIDIEQLLKQLLPVDTEVEETEQPTSETEVVGEQPVRKKDTMMYGNYNSPVLRNTDSDDSDSDEMLPMGDFWPTPEEEEWTMVERSHGSLRSANDIDSDRFYNSGDNLDHSGMRCTLYAVRLY